VSFEPLLLAALFLLAATLYASVGHAGASAYLAIMALVGLAPEVMRPTALVLNLLVATIVIVRFGRAGHLPWRQLPPLVVASVPMAFLGGIVQLPRETYGALVAVVLLAAAWRLATATLGTDPERTRIPVLPGLAAGASIGLLSGLTGTGGGIFLTPILVLAGWARTRDAAGLSGAFILANSAAGLAGVLVGGLRLPAELPFWIVAVGAGGLIGSWLGAARFSVLHLRRALALVLVIAAAKLAFFP
jgi:uncharacterized membrane protein YfcA